MYTIVILSVLAAATAAPHYHHHHHDHLPFHGPRHHPGYGEELFDTRTFWDELNREMHQLDEMLKDFYVKFPSSVSREGIDGNEYKIIIPLTGYKESDIAVKAREGVLMVQAVQKMEGGNQRSYLDVRTLPDCIDLSGTWTYDNDVLNIQFPLKADATTAKPVTTTEVTEFTTLSPDVDHSREEMGHDNDNVQNVDVGNRGDSDAEILTNVIPDNNVEATTYAVDLHNEVEFVPVHY